MDAPAKNDGKVVSQPSSGQRSKIFWSFVLSGIGYALIAISFFPIIEPIRYALLTALLLLALSTYFCLEALFSDERKLLASVALGIAILPETIMFFYALAHIRG